jgi:hypothetical protein
MFGVRHIPQTIMDRSPEELLSCAARGEELCRRRVDLGLIEDGRLLVTHLSDRPARVQGCLFGNQKARLSFSRNSFEVVGQRASFTRAWRQDPVVGQISSLPVFVVDGKDRLRSEQWIARGEAERVIDGNPIRGTETLSVNAQGALARWSIRCGQEEITLFDASPCASPPAAENAVLSRVVSRCQ